MAAKKGRTVEIGGMKVTIDPAIRNDLRLVTLLAAIMDDAESDDVSTIGKMNDFYALVFGSVDKALEVMGAFAEDHGGKCDAGDFLQWLMDALEGTDAKN